MRSHLRIDVSNEYVLVTNPGGKFNVFMSDGKPPLKKLINLKHCLSVNLIISRFLNEYKVLGHANSSKTCDVLNIGQRVQTRNYLLFHTFSLVAVLHLYFTMLDHFTYALIFYSHISQACNEVFMNLCIYERFAIENIV